MMKVEAVGCVLMAMRFGDLTLMVVGLEMNLPIVVGELVMGV